MTGRWPAVVVSGVLFTALLILATLAPEFLSEPDLSLSEYGPGVVPPFGADDRGRPLWEFAAQGARVAAVPSVVAGLLVGLFAAVGGLVR